MMIGISIYQGRSFFTVAAAGLDPDAPDDVLDSEEPDASDDPKADFFDFPSMLFSVPGRA